jgi:hypothetical protein
VSVTVKAAAAIGAAETEAAIGAVETAAAITVTADGETKLY